MKLQPRQSILDMWQAATRYSYAKGAWRWSGRWTRNCTADAEQLLVLLYPATTISSLSLESVADGDTDITTVLRDLGGPQTIPRTIVTGMKEYLTTYRDDQGNPTFAGGSYFRAHGAETEAVLRQRERDVVDAYSMSVTLCLAILGFLQKYGEAKNQPPARVSELHTVRELASQRLSAAMVGLLRSFAVHTFNSESEPGRRLLQTIHAFGSTERTSVRAVNEALDEVRVSLRLSLAEGATQSQRERIDEFDSASDLFECGWAWGVVDGTPSVDYATAAVPLQPAGTALERPNMYFTVSAMDGIRDLFSRRTQVLGLLTPEQNRLANALQNRLNATQQYWTELATFGGDDAEVWPIEDLPWRTTEGSESDYYTLLACAIVIQGLDQEPNQTGRKARRIARLLEELSMRAKITRRPVADDPGVALHIPGMRMSLAGSEKAGAEPIEWAVSSFAMLLLKQMVQVAPRIENSPERAAVLVQADRVWEHMMKRRLEQGDGRELWDAPENVFAGSAPEPAMGPSWYHTERAMEALVQAALTVTSQATPGVDLLSMAAAVLAEAENLLDRELLGGNVPTVRGVSRDADTRTRNVPRKLRSIQVQLRQARDLLISSPGMSLSLAQKALLDLNELTATTQRQ